MGVRFSLPEVILCFRYEALIELERRESEVRSRDGELAWRAAHCPISLGLFDDFLEAGDLPAQLRRRPAAENEESHHGPSDPAPHRRHRPAPRWASRAS